MNGQLADKEDKMAVKSDFILRLLLIPSLLGTLLGRTILASAEVFTFKNCSICGYYELRSDPKDPAYEEVLEQMNYSDEMIQKFQESQNVTILIRKKYSIYDWIERGVDCGGGCGGQSSSSLRFIFESNSEFKGDRWCDAQIGHFNVSVDEQARRVAWTLRFHSFSAMRVAKFVDEENGTSTLLMRYYVNGKDADLVYQQVLFYGSPAPNHD